MSDIQHLLELLKSDNPNKRYDACEELRVARQPLSQEAIGALHSVIKDSNPDVADAAQRALSLHTSPSPSSHFKETSQFPITSIPLWENQKAKLKILLLLFALEFIFTLPWSLFPGALLSFPIALFFWIPNSFTNNSPYKIVGWLLYIGISITIMVSNNKNIVQVLFFILTAMLILNAVGCHVIISDITP